MWNSENRKKEMQPFIDKLINDLSKEGITISFNDTNPKLNNVLFTKDSNTIKISHWSFYRYSGSGYKFVIDDSGKKIKVTRIVITLKDWIFNIIKPIILKRLKVN